jgi:hypothetical protein
VSPFTYAHPNHTLTRDAKRGEGKRARFAGAYLNVQIENKDEQAKKAIEEGGGK